MPIKKLSIIKVIRVKAKGKTGSGASKTKASYAITQKPVCFKRSHTWSACDICRFKDECKPWTREYKN